MDDSPGKKACGIIVVREIIVKILYICMVLFPYPPFKNTNSKWKWTKSLGLHEEMQGTGNRTLPSKTEIHPCAFMFQTGRKQNIGTPNA